MLGERGKVRASPRWLDIAKLLRRMARAHATPTCTRRLAARRLPTPAPLCPHAPPAALPQPVTPNHSTYRDNRNIGRPRNDGSGDGGAGWRPRLGAAITLFGSEVTFGPEHVLGLVTIGVLGGVEVPEPDADP